VYALSEHVEGTPGRQAFFARYSDRIVAQERLVGVFSGD
jgi:hypothetical protein